jgi:glyoxylase-like metal-dependent hydrolase (beta-lactamase superfamily II)
MRPLRLLALLVSIVVPAAAGAQQRPAAPAAGAAGAGAAGAVTRAEFVAMVADYFDWVHWSEYHDYAKPVPRQFADVRTSDRFGKQIECALEEAIVAPDLGGRFHPSRPITRQDAAAVLARAFLVGEAAAATAVGGRAATWQPAGTLTRAEAKAALDRVKGSVATPVQVMPKAGTTSYRRYVNMTTRTPGATIYYTVTDDRSVPPDPTPAGRAYDPTKGFLLFDNPMKSTTDSKVYTLKAMAVKPGLPPSAVRTFVYHIVRPQSAAFEARLVHAPMPASPAVWDIINPADYNRPHVYYIEGSARGVVMDAGQYPASKASLKSFIDTLATKPYDVVLGHNNPDHVEQVHAFAQAGVRVFMTAQDKASVMASKREDFIAAAKASILLSDGDVLDLGNVKMTAYQAPGHSHGQVILADKQDGWVFGSDMFGCNRPATADITNYAGAKMDVFLSLVQQLYANLLKDGGKIAEVYNAHNEVPVGYPGLKNFEAAVQQLIDVGDGASAPSLRGNSPGGQPMPAPQRMSLVGDMWRDRNWIAIWVGGNWGGPVDYLSRPTSTYPCRTTIDYNADGGVRKYAVLSNLEVGGATLVGVDLAWAAPTNGVANSLPGKFDPWTYAYDVTVPAGTRTITVTPTAMSNKFTSLEVNGVRIASRSPRDVAVTDGAMVTIDVVAPDGVTTCQYVLTLRTARTGA